ncbi:uncharacterized protein EAF01_011171 [Botrytis porri]|nr:uncharacterized protein EAF01_011171 [Botrytis porri]KAF7886493.1 hypothetical protein EAF01_011171 [Botrytis porri]
MLQNVVASAPSAIEYGVVADMNNSVVVYFFCEQRDDWDFHG